MPLSENVIIKHTAIIGRRSYRTASANEAHLRYLDKYKGGIEKVKEYTEACYFNVRKRKCTFTEYLRFSSLPPTLGESYQRQPTENVY